MDKLKKIIYTCITGEYDTPEEHYYVDPNFRYICYTDKKVLPQKSIWEFRPLKYSSADNVRNARWHKLYPHKLFPQYEESLWIDGNINITSKEFFEKMYYLRGSEFIATVKHERAKTLSDEVHECIIQKKDSKSTICAQHQLIKSSGFDGNYDGQRFFETNVILRRHCDMRSQKLADDWWYWIKNYSYRDQLSFTFVLWNNQFIVQDLFEDYLRYANFIKITNHGNTPKLLERKVAGLKRKLKIY
ncbi:glycosyltransferase domain-containing protein [Lactovum miscens]|uniref:TOD1/MUCI70 glycosyltransferase-like domain-containing protein n=1 Tax=Lactovum miscens TaxID=190387 RepID=A0A841C6U0_9LACT|nr:glycosyltransferase domain-containing protein [Lactovum miscens]MBB5887997.1 hypothetical protein [Lactovum miscens]